MKKILLPLMLLAMTANAQDFIKKSPSELWLDSVCQTVRITPLSFLDDQSPRPADNAKSIMFSRQPASREVDLSPFRCGPFWVPDPPPLFDDYYYRDYSDYTLRQALLCGLLEGTLDAILSKPKKSGKKEKKKNFDY